MLGYEVAEKVQVGDRVGFYRGTSNGFADAGFDTVAKKNKYGHITLANGKVFDKTGHERVGGYGALMLIGAERLEEMIATRAAQRDLDRRMNDLANTLTDVLRNHRNGHGNYSPLTDDDKARLIALIQAV